MVESIIDIRRRDVVLLIQDTDTIKYGILNMKFDINRLLNIVAWLVVRLIGRDFNRYNLLPIAINFLKTYVESGP